MRGQRAAGGFSGRLFRALVIVAVTGGVVAPAVAAPTTAQVRHPEDLFIVDCLLPGKVRSLGRYNKIQTPRKVVRASVHECGMRGGEWSQDLQDNAWALQAWQVQAEAGDAEAMNNVGEIYEQGVRGAPDFTLAAAWYRKAAEAGSRRGQRNLGALYEQGLGVTADAAIALSWYRRAAGLDSEIDLDAQREIDALREELARTRAEAARARREAETVAGDLAAARAELAAAERRVAEARAAAKRQGAGESPTPPPPVAMAEAAVVASRTRVSDLEAAQDRYRRLLGELEAAEAAGTQIASVRAADLVGTPGPAFEFIRPDLLATRGPLLAPVPRAGGSVEIVGRVDAPLGLAALLADGRPLAPDAKGFFSLSVPATAGTTVRFVALDRASRRAESEIHFQAEPAAPVAAVPPAPPASRARPAAGRAYALIVADGAYRALPPLATARADGEAIAGVLADRYGFSTRLLLDATFLDTMRALSELGKQAGPNDQVLVYFAGHGRLTADGRQGYWLPVDADPDDSSTWIPNAAIARLLGTFAARRVLLVSDSCYAGSFAGGELTAGDGGTAAKSRLALTSGGLAPVLDQGGDGVHSIFARALLTVLQLAEEPLSTAAVTRAVAARVAWKSTRLGLAQTPQLAPIRLAGHEAGELLFVPVS